MQQQQRGENTVQYGQDDRTSPVFHFFPSLRSGSGASGGAISPEGRKVAARIFDSFREDGREAVSAGRLLAEIEATGIRPRTDPRLAKFMATLARRAEEQQKGGSVEGLGLDLSTLQRLVEENVDVLGTIFQNKLVLPEFGSFSEQIRDIFERCRSNTGGKVITIDGRGPE